jgi:hypothetical protein
MIFKKGNGIKCRQDHGCLWYKEIPPDVDFKVGYDFGIISLIGEGYGASGNYGNGELFPYELTDEQKTSILQSKEPNMNYVRQCLINIDSPSTCESMFRFNIYKKTERQDLVWYELEGLDQRFCSRYEACPYQKYVEISIQKSVDNKETIKDQNG